jgi:hypothetical protein
MYMPRGSMSSDDNTLLSEMILDKDMASLTSPLRKRDGEKTMSMMARAMMLIPAIDRSIDSVEPLFVNSQNPRTMKPNRANSIDVNVSRLFKDIIIGDDSSASAMR